MRTHKPRTVVKLKAHVGVLATLEGLLQKPHALAAEEFQFLTDLDCRRGAGSFPSLESRIGCTACTPYASPTIVKITRKCSLRLELPEKSHQKPPKEGDLIL